MVTQNHTIFSHMRSILIEICLKTEQEEQEAIVRNRPAGQTGLTLKECRDMEYLSKVVDETLRYVSFSLVVFREAQMDVNLNGISLSLSLSLFVNY